VRQATDATGAVIDAREWTPYGVELDGAQPGLGYTGEWWDAVVGLQKAPSLLYPRKTHPHEYPLP
jgi:hypothetical protein